MLCRILRIQKQRWIDKLAIISILTTIIQQGSAVYLDPFCTEW